MTHRFSCPTACGILVPRPGIKPMSPALAGRFPTTGPPGKSPLSFWKHSLLLASQTRWWSTYPSLPRTLPPLAQKVLHPTKHSVPGKPETCCKLIFLLPHGVLVWAPPRENSETRIRVQVVYFGGDPGKYQQGCKEVDRGKKTAGTRWELHPGRDRWAITGTRISESSHLRGEGAGTCVHQVQGFG